MASLREASLGPHHPEMEGCPQGGDRASWASGGSAVGLLTHSLWMGPRASAPHPVLTTTLPPATSCGWNACCCVSTRLPLWTRCSPRPSWRSPPVRVSGAPGRGGGTVRGHPCGPWTAGLETVPKNAQGADLAHLPDPRPALRQARHTGACTQVHACSDMAPTLPRAHTPLS